MTRLYRADVQYEYTVGDGRYSSNRVTFQDKASRDLGNALKVMNKYRHQRNVMVYYNSQDPEQAILEPANIGDMTIPLMMGGLFAFLGMFALYQQSLEIKTRGIESYLYQGQSYQKQGRFNEALMEFNKIIELRPHIIIGYFSRGCLYLQEDRWDEAIADLNQAMRIDPTDPLIRFNRGNAYIGKKQYDKAWEDMQKAMDMGFKVKPEILENLKKNMNIGQL
jgi:tetratricopeptide (TPR) repeat protein